jgi:hypothetical protein
MNSRTLLERAAKAAGIPICSAAYDAGILRHPQDHEPWNPLLSDSDALRLAVKLQISIVHRRRLSDGENVAVAAGLYADQYDETETYYEGDPYAATRLAIVRCAASMVKE